MKNKNFTLVFVCLTSNNGLVFLALLVLLHHSFHILHVQISTAVIVPLLKERVHHVLPLGRQRLLSSLFTKSRITDQSWTKKYTIYNLFWIIELHSVHKQKLHLVWHYLVKLLHELNKRDYVCIATSIYTSAIALMIPEYFWASDNGKNNCLKFKMLPPCLILFNLNAKSCIYATTLFFLWFQNNSEHQIMALIFQTV